MRRPQDGREVEDSGEDKVSVAMFRVCEKELLLRASMTLTDKDNLEAGERHGTEVALALLTT